jgi:DNA-binding CsgD family transcriptional regulator
LFGVLTACALAVYPALRSVEKARETQPAPTPAQAPELDDLIARRAELFSARYGMSERESQIMLGILRGHTTAAIRNDLAIAKGTVDTYLQRIYRKCDVHSRQELVELVERLAAESTDVQVDTHAEGAHPVQGTPPTVGQEFSVPTTAPGCPSPHVRRRNPSNRPSRTTSRQSR